MKYMEVKFVPGMTVIHRMVIWKRQDSCVTEHEAVVVSVNKKSAVIRFTNSSVEKTCALSSLRKREP